MIKKNKKEIENNEIDEIDDNINGDYDWEDE